MPVGQSPAHEAGWVAAENARPGTRAWVIERAQMAGVEELAGYTDAVSVRPGQPFGLHLSSTLGDVTVTAYRVGHYGGAGGRAVWSPARSLSVRRRNRPSTASTPSAASGSGPPRCRRPAGPRATT